jgi:DNA polymerase-3 subunit gamma/tau
MSAQPRLWLEVLLLGLLAETPITPQTQPQLQPLTQNPVATPIPTPISTEVDSPKATTDQSSDLGNLWQQILASLELPSTRMLLSQQGELVRLDNTKAVVRVAPNWLAMVQSRLPLLEQATEKALGQSRQVVLETGTASIITPPVVAETPPIPPNPPDAAPLPNPPPPVTPTKQNEPMEPGNNLKAQAQRLAEFFNGEVIEAEENE